MPKATRTPSRWTTRADVVAALRRRWAKGDLLAAVVEDRPAVPQQVPIKGPTPREVGAAFAEVQAWVRGWENAGQGLRVEHAPIGGRLVGVNRVPARAWVDDETHLWRLVGVGEEVAAVRDVVACTDRTNPALSQWVRDHPRDALAAADIWRQVLDVVRWVVEQGTPAVYVRQIDAPGVDTKFVEANRVLIGALLDVVLPADRIDPARSRSQFAARYRLATKPAYVRLRRLDASGLLDDWRATAGLAPTELTMRAEDLARAQVAGRTVLVVENEITYLALPAFPDTVAIFGGGYAASRLAAVDWLADRQLLYWGDLDTHGFAILDGLRAALPHARSVLMDRATLETHRAHWGAETSPHNAHLAHLDDVERHLYRDLVEGRYGEKVRLEQERVRFGHVERCLEAAINS